LHINKKLRIFFSYFNIVSVRAIKENKEKKYAF
jgi:hypothetical protein